MQKQTQFPSLNTNPSKAQRALEKLNQANERARQAIAEEITRLDKACKRDHYLVGEAVLNEPGLHEKLVPHLSESLRARIETYAGRKEEMARLRAEMPK